MTASAMLHTSRLLLRPWTREDIPPLVALANNRKIWLNMRDVFPHPYTEGAARNWLEVAATIPRHHHFAIDFNGRAIGGIGLHGLDDVHCKTAEIGYWLGEPYWGRGFATEAVGRISAWGLEQAGFARLQAGVYEWNPASMRVLEKSGYRLEAKLEKSVWKDGKLIDQYLYARWKL